MTIAKAAETILKYAPAPMHVRDIHAQITNQKLFEFKAKDPVSVLSSTLRKGSQFEKTGPGIYKLK